MANNDERDVVRNARFQAFGENEMENGGVAADAVPTVPGDRPVEIYANKVVDKNASHYKMNHKKRGVALIFNHEEFNGRLKPRLGTDKDCKILKSTLENLGFDVRDHTDLTFSEVTSQVRQVAVGEDHTHHDCFLLAVLSHGNTDIIQAHDTSYEPEILWSFFTADNCPSLAGKPKMFFFQACRGGKLDRGVNLLSGTEIDGKQYNTYKIPIHADFLIVYATVEGVIKMGPSTKNRRYPKGQIQAAH